MPHTLREYALLGDGERGAIVGPRGDLVWMCFPHWDSDAALLGADRRRRHLRRDPHRAARVGRLLRAAQPDLAQPLGDLRRDRRMPPGARAARRPGRVTILCRARRAPRQLPAGRASSTRAQRSAATACATSRAMSDGVWRARVGRPAAELERRRRRPRRRRQAATARSSSTSSSRDGRAPRPRARDLRRQRRASPPDAEAAWRRDRAGVARACRRLRAHDRAARRRARLRGDARHDLERRRDGRRGDDVAARARRGGPQLRLPLRLDPRPVLRRRGRGARRSARDDGRLGPLHDRAAGRARPGAAARLHRPRDSDPR